MNEISASGEHVPNGPERVNGEVVQSFDFRTILMILTQSNLGESHIAGKIREVIEHVLGEPLSIDDPDALEQALAATTAAILQQYPELEHMPLEIAALVTSDTARVSITLQSQTL